MQISNANLRDLAAELLEHYPPELVKVAKYFTEIKYDSFTAQKDAHLAKMREMLNLVEKTW